MLNEHFLQRLEEQRFSKLEVERYVILTAISMNVYVKGNRRKAHQNLTPE